MQEPVEILKKHWNHSAFRHPQEEIIKSVIDGKDTLAIMPTGGGKSICFQVPAMMMDGICLVISPLIALMKDQVANLEKKGIKAIALTGGISIDETSNLLDNCRFGPYKFLYLSPERLQSEWIVDRIKSLPVNLIAIDEAHCVSQWGHDFRPAYLKIHQLKEHFPKIPFLALTASATNRVKTDIIEQLHLKSPEIFTSSFARPNLAYMVLEGEDKLYNMGRIFKKHPEPSIVYVRSRKACIDLSAQITAMGFPATYYHGGMSSSEKEKSMKRWQDEQVRVMVATNAFGMGIDKSNVRTVIHMQLPENLENYYQEAGRAGRDGAKAFAVLLLGPGDELTAQNQVLENLPDKAFLKLVYVKLCNFFQIAYGEAPEGELSFSLNAFCNRYDLPIARTFNAIQFLDRQGVISIEQQFSERTSVQFIIESREVLRYMSLNPQDEEMILTMLRTYPGIYDQKIAVNHHLLAKKSKKSPQDVLELFQKLEKLSVIDLTSRSADTGIFFNEVREDDHTINRIAKHLESQNKRKKELLLAMLSYVRDREHCRSVMISEYFGEKDSTRCGVCSNCLNLKKAKPASADKAILKLLGEQKMSSREICDAAELNADDVIFALRELLDDGLIALSPDNRYQIIR